MPVTIEQHVDWIGRCIDHMRKQGLARIEALPDAQDAWVEHVNEVAKGTMFTADSCNSWYNGQNIEGKPRVFLPYVGGLPAYMERCNAVAADGYTGFALA
jgi:cyclohexanone monooxygenase